MLKAIRSSFVALTVCFAMAAGAQSSVQVGKDGKVKINSGGTKIEINSEGDETTIETSGDTQIEVETDDDDDKGTRSRSSSSSSSSTIELSGSARKQTIACTGNTEVVIQGASNNITLTGECKRVEVTGSANTVTMDTVGELDVTGSANTVSWKKASGSAKKPKVSSSGTANKVFQAK